MPATVRLPHFENPPVTQVVLGVIFEPLSRLRGSHFGLFWNELNLESKFPVVEEFPYEKAVLEDLEESAVADSQPGQVKVSVAGRAPVPRAVFSGENGTSQVAIQRDMIQVAWSKSNDQPYARYDAPRALLQEVLSKFEKFLSSRHLGRLRLLQAEVSYTNTLPLRRGNVLIGLEELLDVRFLGTGVPLPPSDHMHSLQRHTLTAVDGRPWARLYITIDTQIQGGAEKAVLGLSTQGPANPSNVFDFLDRGHEVIVQTFVDITTSRAHQAWGKLQGGEE